MFNLKKRKPFKREREDKHWTTEEDQTIIQLYPTTPSAELAVQLKRSPTAVRCRALTLKVKRRYSVPELSFTDVEAAYLAGLIDGDGTITVDTSRGRNERYEWVQVTPVVRIANTSLKLLNAVRKLINIRTVWNEQRRTPSLKFPQRKPVYTLSIRNVPRAYALLKRINPHLILKKERGNLLLKYCASRLSKNIGAKYDEKEEVIIGKIRALNRRGVTLDV